MKKCYQTIIFLIILEIINSQYPSNEYDIPATKKHCKMAYSSNGNSFFCFISGKDERGNDINTCGSFLKMNIIPLKIYLIF